MLVCDQIFGSAGVSSLLTGLRAYYKLEDTSDSSGNNLTLTNHNSVTFSAAKVNNGAVITAASTNYLFASNAGGAFGFDSATSFTLSAWMKFTASSLRGAFFGQLFAEGYGFRTSDSIIAAVQDDSSHAITVDSVTTYDDGNFHLAVMTADRLGNLTLYVDNVQKGTPASMSTIGDVIGGSGNFNIGRDDGGANGDGIFDEVGLWSRVLTAGELSTLWNSGNGTTYPF